MGQDKTRAVIERVHTQISAVSHSIPRHSHTHIHMYRNAHTECRRHSNSRPLNHSYLNLVPNNRPSPVNHRCCCCCYLLSIAIGSIIVFISSLIINLIGSAVIVCLSVYLSYRYTHAHTHTLTHPPTYPPTHSLTRSLTHSLTHIYISVVPVR